MAIGARTRRSRVYKEALGRARSFMDNPGKLDGLLSRARAKAADKHDALRKISGQVSLLMDLVKYYRLGEYRDVSAKAILLAIASLLYFVIPADLIPDVLLGFGYIDDVALFGWTINSINDELKKFEAWLAVHRSPVGRPIEPREGLLIEGELVKD